MASTGQTIQPHITHPHSDYTHTTSIYLPRLKCQPPTSSQFILNETSLANWLNFTVTDPQLTITKFNMSRFTYEYVTVEQLGYPSNGKIEYLALAELVRPIDTVDGLMRILSDPSQLYKYSYYYTSCIDTAIFSTSLQFLECVAFTSSFDLEVTVKQNTGTISVLNRSDVGPIWNSNASQEDTRAWSKIYTKYWFMQLCNSLICFRIYEGSKWNTGNTVLTKSDEYQLMVEREQRGCSNLKQRGREEGCLVKWLRS